MQKNICQNQLSRPSLQNMELNYINQITTDASKVLAAYKIFVFKTIQMKLKTSSICAKIPVLLSCLKFDVHFFWNIWIGSTHPNKQYMAKRKDMPQEGVETLDPERWDIWEKTVHVSWNELENNETLTSTKWRQKDS